MYNREVTMGDINKYGRRVELKRLMNKRSPSEEDADRIMEIANDLYRRI